MTQSPQLSFRFGVNLFAAENAREWADRCRSAEELGYDTIGVPDHLGMLAPFPALVAAAAATERATLNTFVLNTAFYNPALLARDVAGTDQLIEGRLELGLGAGYVKQEFETAGLPFGTGGERVSHLENTVIQLRRLFADPEYRPRPANQDGPPLLLAGNGDRTLEAAAKHADIIGFAPNAPARKGEVSRIADSTAMTERVSYVRTLLGGRADKVEFNQLVPNVTITDNRRAAAEEFCATPFAFPINIDVEAALATPTLLFGTPRQIADQLIRNREEFGISYITVLQQAMADFAKVIELLR